MKTILCLHASASSGRQWRSLQQALGNEYRLLMPDLLGYGGEEFSRTRRFSLDDEVDNLLRQIGNNEERIAGPIDVIGHSYGGGVALRFAHRFPDRVRSLTLFEPAQPLALFEAGLHTRAAREVREAS